MQHSPFDRLFAVEAVYFARVVCRLTPEMDLSAFEQAWQSAINRHDVLKTSFLWVREVRLKDACLPHTCAAISTFSL